MEQVVIAPPEIVAAIDGDSGDLAAIEAWVAAGGDPNAKIDISHEIREPPGSWYETLLHRAAYFKWPDICEFLLSRGARVRATDATEGCPMYSDSIVASSEFKDGGSLETYDGRTPQYGSSSHGADPNLHATHVERRLSSDAICYIQKSFGGPVTRPGFNRSRASSFAVLIPEDDPPCRWHGGGRARRKNTLGQRYLLRRLDDD